MKKIIEGTTLSQTNIHVEGSCCVTERQDMVKVLNELRRRYPSNPVLMNRTNESMVAEWVLHNLFYKLRIMRAHTRDVDINYPLRWVEKVAYKITGWFL